MEKTMSHRSNLRNNQAMSQWVILRKKVKGQRTNLRMILELKFPVLMEWVPMRVTKKTRTQIWAPMKAQAQLRVQVPMKWMTQMRISMKQRCPMKVPLKRKRRTTKRMKKKKKRTTKTPKRKDQERSQKRKTRKWTKQLLLK